MVFALHVDLSTSLEIDRLQKSQPAPHGYEIALYMQMQIQQSNIQCQNVFEARYTPLKIETHELVKIK